MYGIVNQQEIFDIVEAVCQTLGNGKNHSAHKLILGTIAQETLFATYEDPTPFRAGSGLCQIDRIAFDDVINRTSQKNIDIVFEAFNINLMRVTYEMLEYNALLSVIVCRLFYKLIPEEIGASLVEWAMYWKKYYNTKIGKGTKEQFIANYNYFVKGAIK